VEIGLLSIESSSHILDREFMQEDIQTLEERLRIAMLNSDVDALDELLSEELLFTNHLGIIVSKE
jgi:hypothetical protein